MTSGRGNPNAHERASAKEKAETLMARHRVTLEQMRDLYRQEMGLPPKAGARPKGKRPGTRPREVTVEEIYEWLREEIEKQKRARERQAAMDRARAIIEGEDAVERDHLARNLRAAIDDVLSDHQDFGEFLIHIGAKGIRLRLGQHQSLWELSFNWPPCIWGATLGSLGPGYNWPSLIERGLRYDAWNPYHEQARDTIPTDWR